MHVKYTGAVELPVLPAVPCAGEDTWAEEQRDCAQRHGMATIQHPSSLPTGQHSSWHRLDASSCPACWQQQLMMLERGRLPSMNLQSLEERWM